MEDPVMAVMGPLVGEKEEAQGMEEEALAGESPSLVVGKEEEVQAVVDPAMAVAAALVVEKGAQGMEEQEAWAGAAPCLEVVPALVDMDQALAVAVAAPTVEG
ncbi:hypothetical protein DV515_00015735 [Chloebia gouldiae]|uniref:Uncharacterized protein n=1 Tax=Chloebia gouldiae TaxID=44316 RepID=A0A3L8RUD8_CHLGU|nr:hypothetical protein DV515_00015735 [Chloebia gouldiae]